MIKFYFLELIFTFSLTYVFFLVSTRTSNPPPLPPLLVRLFSVCAVVPILLLFWAVTESQDTYHGSLYFISFLFFSLSILILLVREKHRKTLYKFLLIKINSGRQITYRDKNSERKNNKTKISGRQKY